MGWLFGKKGEDALYRGDAPASSPGYDGVDPSAYQRETSGRAYDPGSTGTTAYPSVSATPYPQVSANPYQTAAPGPQQAHVHPRQHPGQQQPGQQFSIPGQPFGAGVPPEFAAAMTFAQNQQQVIKRTLTRFLIGFLIPLLLIGGLVVGGFVLVDRIQDGIDNPFDFSLGGAPDTPFGGVVGTAGEVILGENTYSITIEEATAQASAAWGSYASAASGGFLVIQLSLTRTDSAADVSQISWYDWQFAPEAGGVLEGQLLAGGYEPLLSTLNLAPDETASGLIAFDTTESSGTLSLTTYEGAWAQWQISAMVPAVGLGALGTPVHPEAGEVPFSVTVVNPRWVSTGDPAIRFDPSSGSYLIFDVSVILDEGALDPTSSLSISNDSWQFLPDGATGVSSDNGVTGADGVTISPGQAATASTLIAFDTVRSPGTLNLINTDGSVLATWVVPIL